LEFQYLQSTSLAVKKAVFVFKKGFTAKYTAHGPTAFLSHIPHLINSTLTSISDFQKQLALCFVHFVAFVLSSAHRIQQKMSTSSSTGANSQSNEREDENNNQVDDQDDADAEVTTIQTIITETN
jgi:hypothetical protein